MSKLSDKMMISLLKKGDKDAFKIIFNEFYYQLYFFCRKYIADQEDAKDVLQNVFLRLWEKKNEIEIKVSLKAYLYRSVQNECLNYLRAIRPNLSISGLENEFDVLNKNCFESPDIETENREIERMIDSIIDALPIQCRQIFIMSRIKGMRNKDIAKKLSVSVRTVDTQIYRALKKMKIGLKDFLASD